MSAKEIKLRENYNEYLIMKYGFKWFKRNQSQINQDWEEMEKAGLMEKF